MTKAVSEQMWHGHLEVGNELSMLREGEFRSEMRLLKLECLMKFAHTRTETSRDQLT